VSILKNKKSRFCGIFCFSAFYVIIKPEIIDYSMEQRTRFKIIVYVILAVIALTLLSFWVWYASSWRRDFQRVGDLKQIQVAMSRYYSQYGTYLISGCESGTRVDECFVKQSNILRSFRISDPLSSGYYNYIIGSLNEDFYEINFALESGVGGLPAGRYVLTKEGVRR